MVAPLLLRFAPKVIPFVKSLIPKLAVPAAILLTAPGLLQLVKTKTLIAGIISPVGAATGLIGQQIAQKTGLIPTPFKPSKKGEPLVVTDITPRPTEPPFQLPSLPSIPDIPKPPSVLTAGAIGAAIGAAFAGIIPLIKDRKIKEEKLPIAQLPPTPQLQPSLEPFGATQPLEEVVAPEMIPTAMPSIKITNKPQINISFKKSRRFINQQVLVKQ